MILFGILPPSTNPDWSSVGLCWIDVCRGLPIRLVVLAPYPRLALSAQVYIINSIKAGFSFEFACSKSTIGPITLSHGSCHS